MRSACGASPTRRPTSRTRFTPTSISGQRDAVNPARTGTKAAAHYTLDVPAGGSQTVRLRLAASQARRRLRRLRRRFSTAASPTPTSSTSGSRRKSLERRPAPGAPPGAGRHAVEQAVLLLRSRAVAARAQEPSAARRRAARRAEHRVVPHAQRRHDLDAGQVGVPVVRGLGSGLPHDLRWRWSTSISRRSSCC